MIQRLLYVGRLRSACIVRRSDDGKYPPDIHSLARISESASDDRNADDAAQDELSLGSATTHRVVKIPVHPRESPAATERVPSDNEAIVFRFQIGLASHCCRE